MFWLEIRFFLNNLRISTKNYQIGNYAQEPSRNYVIDNKGS